jgi:hypothetical protein
LAFSAFDDKSHPPTNADVAAVLDDAGNFWERLRSEISSRYDPVVEDWTFSGKKWGGVLRLNHKKRAVLYMTPQEGKFHVGLALGEKAVEAATGRGLQKPLLEIIDSSPKYAEGRGVRLEVNDEKHVDWSLELAAIKMEN